MDALIQATHRLIQGKTRPDLVDFFTRVLCEYNGYRLSYFSNAFLQACEDSSMYWDDAPKVNLALAHLEVAPGGKPELVNPRNETPHWPPWIVSPDATMSVLTGSSLPEQSRWHARYHQYGGGKDQGLPKMTRRVIEEARALAMKMSNVFRSAMSRSKADAMKYKDSTLRKNYQTFLERMRTDDVSARRWCDLLSDWLRAWDSIDWEGLVSAKFAYSRDHLVWAASFVSKAPDVTHIARCLEDATLGIYDRFDLKNIYHSARRHPQSVMMLWCLLKTIETLGDMARALTHNMANIFSQAVSPRAEHGYIGTTISPKNNTIKVVRLPTNPRGLLASGDRAVYAREAAVAATLLSQAQQQGHAFAVNMKRYDARPDLWREGSPAPKPTDLDPLASKNIPAKAWLNWVGRYNARRIALNMVEAFYPAGLSIISIWEKTASQSTIYIAPNILKCVEHLIQQLEPDEDEPTIYNFKTLHPDIVNARSIQKNVWEWASKRVWRHPCWEGTTWLNATLMGPMHAVFITGCESREASEAQLKACRRIERSITEDESVDEQDLIEIQENDEPPPAQEPRVTVSPLEWATGMQATFNQVAMMRGHAVQCSFFTWWANVESDFDDQAPVLLAIGQCLAWASMVLARTSPQGLNIGVHATLMAGAAHALLFDDSIQEVLTYALSCEQQQQEPLNDPNAEGMVMTQMRLTPLQDADIPSSPLDAVPLLARLVEKNDFYVTPFVEFLKSLPFSSPSRATSAPSWPAFGDDDDDDGGNLLVRAAKQAKRFAGSDPADTPAAKRPKLVQGLISDFDEISGIVVAGLSVFASVFFYILSSSATPIKPTLPIIKTMANIVPDRSAWQLFVQGARVMRPRLGVDQAEGTLDIDMFTRLAPDYFTGWNEGILNTIEATRGMPGTGKLAAFLWTCIGIFSTIDMALSLWYVFSKMRARSARKEAERALAEFDVVAPRDDRAPLVTEEQRRLHANAQTMLTRQADRERACAFWRRALIENETYRYTAQACVAIRAVGHVGRLLWGAYAYGNDPLMSNFVARISSDPSVLHMMETIGHVAPLMATAVFGGGIAAMFKRSRGIVATGAVGIFSLGFVTTVLTSLSQTPTTEAFLLQLVSLFDAAVASLLAYRALKPNTPVNNNANRRTPDQPLVDVNKLVPDADAVTNLRMASTAARILLHRIST